MAYSVQSFLKTLGSSDKNVQIQDTNNNVVFNINPFSIRNTFIHGNLVEISLYSGNKINLDFNTTTESQLAISLLQSRIETLVDRNPIYIDRLISEYISTHPIIGATGPKGSTGSQGATGSTGSVTLGGDNFDIQFNNNGILGGNSIFQFDGSNISLTTGSELRLNGLSDANWFVGRATASGNILSSSALQINVAGGSGEGFEVINTAQNVTLFQLLGVNGDSWFKSPNITIDDISYHFPSQQGATNSVLSNDGIGNLSWVDINSLSTTYTTLLVSGTATVIDAFSTSIKSAKYFVSCDSPGLSPSTILSAEFLICNPSDNAIIPVINIYATASNGDIIVNFDVRRNTLNNTVEVIGDPLYDGIYVTLVKQYI